MPSFQQRSYQKELLDRDDIPFEDIQQNMKELEFINHFLGGHNITLKGLFSLVKNTDGKNIRISEIGCGGGDNLYAIKCWAEMNNKEISISGIDINPECISYARNKNKNKGIDFICSDYRDHDFDNKPDIIFSSLFCHHFTNEQLVYMLKWMNENCTTGFFINDLHRHPVAFYSIKCLTRLFSKSYLVKNDAPLSVRRGFIKKDWNTLFMQAGLAPFHCQWKWAFRWLVCYTKNGTTKSI